MIRIERESEFNFYIKINVVFIFFIYVIMCKLVWIVLVKVYLLFIIMLFRLGVLNGICYLLKYLKVNIWSVCDSKSFLFYVWLIYEVYIV